MRVSRAHDGKVSRSTIGAALSEPQGDDPIRCLSQGVRYSNNQLNLSSARLPVHEDPLLGSSDRIHRPDARVLSSSRMAVGDDEAEAKLKATFDEARPHGDAEEQTAVAAMQARLGGGASEPTTIDRYQIVGRIGRGGMGLVFKAVDSELGRDVAIKLIQAKGADSNIAEAQLRLTREAQALARISHPNVIPIYDVGAYDQSTISGAYLAGVPQDGVYIVMELVDGDDLGKWLVQDHDWREVLSVFLDAGHGLAAAHEKDLVHRDFKPGNVLIGRDGRARVLDFGLARSIDSPAPATEAEDGQAVETRDDETGNLRLTRAGVVMGTPRYMAPEQLYDGTADARSDQFSFCCSLWEALAGHPPYAARELKALREAKMTGKWSEPENLRDAPAWVYRLLERGLTASPDGRYPSMAILIATLERRRRRARRWLLWGSVAGGVTVAAIGGAFVGSSTTETKPPPEQVEGVEPGPTAPSTHDDRIAILPFTDETGDERLDFAADGLPHLLATELSRVDGLDVVGHYRLRERVSPDATPVQWRDAATQMGAGHALSGYLSKGDEGVVLRLVLQRADDSAPQEFERRVPVEALPEVVRALAGEVASAALGRKVEARREGPRDFSFERALQLGIAALERDELLEAEADLERAAELDPSSGEVHYYLAIVSAWRNRPRADTIAIIDRALEAELTPKQRAFMVAYRTFVARQFASAIEEFAAADAKYPGDRYVTYGRFEALFHGGQLEQSMTVFERLTEISPSFSLGLYHVLEYYASRGNAERFDWGMAHARAVKWKALPQWEVWRKLFDHDHKSAVDALVPFAEDEANLYWAPEMLIATYLLAGQAPLALALAQQWDETTPGIRGLLPLISVRAAMDDEVAFDQVLARALRAAQAEPAGRDRIKYWIELGLFALPGEDAEILGSISDGLAASVQDEIDQSDQVRLALALLAGALDDRAALEDLSSSSLPSVAASARAFLAERAGKPAAAATAWREAIASTPDPTFLHVERYLLARALEQAGDREASKAACEAVGRPRFVQISWGAAMRACQALGAE
jgi:TolB-like protein